MSASRVVSTSVSEAKVSEKMAEKANFFILFLQFKTVAKLISGAINRLYGRYAPLKMLD